jgi:hypothetical protein
MPKSMRPVVKLEDGEGGLQEEAGAVGGVQRRQSAIGERSGVDNSLRQDSGFGRLRGHWMAIKHPFL